MSRSASRVPARQVRPALLRQGDVLLVRVGALPDDRHAKPRDAGRVILAYGEVTGHAHAIAESSVVHFDAPNATEAARRLLASVGLTVELGPESAPTFLEVPTDAELAHDEHGTIALAPGQYVVLRQREQQAIELRDAGMVERDRWHAAFDSLATVRESLTPVLEYAKAFADQWSDEEEGNDAAPS